MGVSLDLMILIYLRTVIIPRNLKPNHNDYLVSKKCLELGDKRYERANFQHQVQRRFIRIAIKLKIRRFHWGHLVNYFKIILKTY